MDQDEFLTRLGDELPRLHRLAQRLAPAGTEADDLLQDVLERAWKARATFREEAQLSTWLHRILVNRVRDLAARGPAGQLLPDDDLLGTLSIGDPAEIVQAAEDDQHLRAALARLPVEDRMVLVLHDDQGWPVAHIAELGGWTQAATHKRLQRSRLRMIQLLSRTSGVLEQQSDSCRWARTVLDRYLDGTLDDTAERQVEVHLRTCEHCPPLAQALLGLRAALSRPHGGAAEHPRLHSAMAALRRETATLRQTPEP